MPIVVAVRYVICRSFGSRRRKEAITIVIAGKNLPVGTSLQTKGNQRVKMCEIPLAFA